VRYLPHSIWDIHMNHKRHRAKRHRAGGARHGFCKPQKASGNSLGKGDRFGKLKAADVLKILSQFDQTT